MTGKAAKKLTYEHDADIVERFAAQVEAGNARTFAARKPRSDKGIGGVDFSVHPHGTSRQEHRDRGDAARLELAQQFQPLLVGKDHILEVAGKFGIGLFAKHHDGDIDWSRWDVAVLRQDRIPARGFGGLLDPGPD
jgi:hypothetical protein